MPSRKDSRQPPNPRRQMAGRLNRQKRKGLTAAGRQRLREAALATKPWTRTAGPKTPAGKLRSAANGKRRQVGPLSIRELRAMADDVSNLANEMAALREALSKAAK